MFASLTRRAAIAAVLMLIPTLASAQSAAKLPVVASFSILADFVSVVGGDRVAVKALVGPNGDAHVFTPSPADARALAAAKVVFVNGLGLEGWVDRLVKASGTTAPVVVATTGIDPIQMEDEHDHGGKGRSAGPALVADPHAWQAVPNAKIYVANVRDGLIAADPEGRAVYEANAAAYLASLDALDTEVRAAVDRVPPEKRRVISTHDAFGYFAKAYGITFLAPQGRSTEAEATAKQVAALIRQIKAEKIRAVFVENVTDPRLVERIAKETGVSLGGELYSDALSPSTGPAATYIAMVRNNVRLLTAAMAGA
jgi:zinc/manganese transport system substrate-binding protein